MTQRLPERFSLIQWASYFLEFYSQKTYYLENHLDLDWAKDAPEDEVEYIRSMGKTQVDTFSLFEKRLCHELTHTDPAGHALDPASSATTGSGGWDIAISLAEPDGHQLAENLALAASAAYIISQGGIISKDGSIAIST